MAARYRKQGMGKVVHLGFGGDVSRVLASTFSRRAPSGQLGKDWTWDDDNL